MDATDRMSLFTPTRKSYLNIEVRQRPERWVHSLHCTEQTAGALDRETAWMKAWPNHCPVCSGWGVVGDGGGDWVDYGSTKVQLPWEPDPCDNCIEQGCCPRCGEQIIADVDAFNDWLENERPCPFCDWQHGKSTDDAKPEIPECYCWEWIDRQYGY